MDDKINKKITKRFGKRGKHLRKTIRKYLVPLTDVDRLLLQSYCTLADCLGTYLGSGYEIAVHSFGEGDSFTRTIVNAGLSGRVALEEIPESVYPLIEQFQFLQKHGDPIMSTSFSVRPNGRKFKTAAIGIIGSEEHLIGMICFNSWLDIPFSEILHNFSIPSYLDTAMLPLQGTDSSRYDSAIRQEILKVREAVMDDSKIPAKFKRKEIVRRLNDAGIFKVKNAIQICADTLDITIATIYMHIRNLDSN